MASSSGGGGNAMPGDIDYYALASARSGVAAPAQDVGEDIDYFAVARGNVVLRPPPSTTETAEEDEGTGLADYGLGIAEGMKEAVSGGGWMLERAGRATGLKDVEAYGKDIQSRAGEAQDVMQSKMSPSAKASAAKEYVVENPDGSYSLGDAWSDPHAVGLAGAKSLAGTALGMGVGAVLTKGAMLVPALAKMPKLAAALGYGAGEASVAAPSAAAGAGERVRAMDAEKLEAHPEYQLALQGTGDPDQARELVARAAEDDTFALAALTTFATGAPAGAVLGKAFSGAPLATTRARSIATGAVTEGAQEFVQSGAEQFAQNYGVQNNADASQSLLEGVPNAAVGGMVSGAAMGGGFGAVAPVESVAVQPDDEFALGDEPAMADDEGLSAEATPAESATPDQQHAAADVMAQEPGQSRPAGWVPPSGRPLQEPPAQPAPAETRQVTPATPAERAAWQQEVISELYQVRKAQQALFREGRDDEAKALNEQLASLLDATKTLPPAHWLQARRGPELPGSNPFATASMQAAQRGHTGLELGRLYGLQSAPAPAPAASPDTAAPTMQELADAAPAVDPLAVAYQAVRDYEDAFAEQNQYAQEITRARAEAAALFKDRTPEGAARRAEVNARLDQAKRAQAEASARVGRAARADIKAQAEALKNQFFDYQHLDEATFDEQAITEYAAKAIDAGVAPETVNDIVAAYGDTRSIIQELDRAIAHYGPEPATIEPATASGRDSAQPAARAAEPTIQRGPQAGLDFDAVTEQSAAVTEQDATETFATMHLARQAAVERGLAETHRVVPQGGRFAIVPKTAQQQAAIQDAMENPQPIEKPQTMHARMLKERGVGVSDSDSATETQRALTAATDSPVVAAALADPALAEEERVQIRENDAANRARLDAMPDEDVQRLHAFSKLAGAGQDASVLRETLLNEHPDDLKFLLREFDAHQAATSPHNDLPDPTDAQKEAARSSALAEGMPDLKPTRAHDAARFPQESSDGTLSDAKLFGNAARAEAIRIKGFHALNKVDRGMVLAQVVGVLHEKEVIQFVVKSIPVDVMNMLIGGQWSTKSILHDPSVLTHRLSVPGNVPVPMPVARFIDELAAAVKRFPASSVAEKVDLPGVGRLSEEAGATPSTGSARRLNAGATTEMSRGGTSKSQLTPGENNPASAANKGDDTHVEISVAGQKDTVNINPTPAQKEAGTYKKAHISLHGLDITIESPKGSKRSGTSPDGTRWENTIHQHYGYFKRTEGADDEHVYVFVGDNPESGKVFVVDQVNADGSFDEHKVMLGFSDKLKAIAGYKKNYQKGWKVGPVTEMTVDEFKAWLKDGDTTKPLALNDVAPTSEGKTAANNKASTKNAKPKKQLLPAWATERNLDNGARVEVTEKVDYLTPGETYTVSGITSKQAYFTSTKGSGTFVKHFQIKSAIDVGKMRIVVADQPPEGRGSIASMNIPRTTLQHFPDVVLHADESIVKKHPQYAAAKAGDATAAQALVADTASDSAMDKIAELLGDGDVELVPIHALESEGVNEIPVALAAHLARRLGATINDSIVQVNTVGHTGADGFHRLANQARFEGDVAPKRFYLVVDDFVGQGGTLANLIGYIESKGGQVVGATVLTGKPFSANIAPDQSLIESVRKKHGPELEQWWRDTFGFGFDALTRSEARYLEKTPDADTIRNRIAAARPESSESPPDSLNSEGAASDHQAPPSEGLGVSGGDESAASKPAAATPTTRIEDTGDNLYWNRKNPWLGGGLTWSEVKGENETLRVKLVQKAKVWAKPDWGAILEAAPERDRAAIKFVARMIKSVYDAIPNSPDKTDDDSLQLYIKAVAAVRDAAMELVTNRDSMVALMSALGERLSRARLRRSNAPGMLVNEVVSLGDLARTEQAQRPSMQPIFAAVFPKTLETNRFARGSEEIKMASLIGKKAIDRMRWGESDFAAAMKDIEKGWPAKQEAWERQGYSVKAGAGAVAAYYEGKNFKSGEAYVSASIQLGRDIIDSDTFATRDAAEAWAGAKVAELHPQHLLLNKRGRLVSTHATEEDAKDAARKEVKRESGGAPRDEAVAFDAIQRIGEDRRKPGQNITAEQLKDAFGFRGVNFGKYVKQDERQAHLNHAYDALHDLAALLDVPPRAISLGGMVGIAFGAQGTGGRAAAHFVPGFNEINITKDSGAGVVAHEWAHALDHHFGTLAGVGATKEPYASELRSFRRGQDVEVRQEILDAFKAIVATMKSRAQSPEEMQAVADTRAVLAKEKLEQFIKRHDLRAKVLHDKRAAQALANIEAGDIGEYKEIPGQNSRKRMKEAAGEHVITVATAAGFDIAQTKALHSEAFGMQYAREQKEGEKAQRIVHTDFYRHSSAADKSNKPYWSTPREMFARSFEAWVFDQLSGQQLRSDYLVRQNRADQGKSNPDFLYPAAAEREVINKAIHTLVDAIETKETETGVSLFSSGAIAAGVKGGGRSTRSDVKTWIAPILLKWHNGPEVSVVQSYAELPAHIRTDFENSMDAASDVVFGVYDPGTGTVYLVADDITDADHAQRVLAHEAVGHWAVEDVLGEKLDDVLRKVDALSRTEPRIRKVAAEVDARFEGAELDDTTRSREILAHMAEGGIKHMLVDLWVGRLRNFLRRLGFTLQFSHADLRGILAQAARRLETGRGGGYLARGGRPRNTVYSTGRTAAATATAPQKSQHTNEERLLILSERGKGSALPKALGALSLRMLADVAETQVPEITTYQRTVDAMQSMRNRMAEQTDEEVKEWMTWAKRNKAQADQLTDMMYEATIAGTDPEGEFVPLDVGAAQKRIALLREQKMGRSGEVAKHLLDEMKELNELIKGEPKRREDYERLKPRFDAMSADQKRFYRKVRDAYQRRFEETQQLLEERISAAIADQHSRRAAIDAMRARFESAKVRAPYFPLQRFGRFWLETTTEPGGKGEREFYMFDNAGDQTAMKIELQKKGFKYNIGTHIEQSRQLQGVTAGFINELMGRIDSQQLNEEKRAALKDDVYQMLLETLPARSMRKQFIHRKKVAGYSHDAIRTYASSMLRGAYQLSRLKYAHQLQDLVLDAVETAKAQNSNRATDMANELILRHEWVMNPGGSQAAQQLTSFGFFMHLGLTAAGGIVNMLQTWTVAMPVIASHFGVQKSAQALVAASGEFMKGGKRLSLEGGLTGEEAKAYKELHARGAIDKSQSHDLVGIAESDTTAYTDLGHRVRNIVSFVFHKAEVYNREVTAMATYRLAREAGKSFDEAVELAYKLTIDSHFDYSNVNRPRYLQNDFMKVFAQFKQYALNMTYYLVRNAWLALKGKDAQTRRMALTQLVGTLGMTSILGGAQALPLGAIFMPLNLLAAALSLVGVGDDDEPFDAETEFVWMINRVFGEKAAKWVLRGAGSQLTGYDLTSRIGLGDLWVREPDRDLDGETLWTHYAEQAVGPVFGGSVVSWFRAHDIAKNDDDMLRAIEAAMPKFARDAIRFIRYVEDGATTRSGAPIIEQFSPAELAGQLFGFSPVRLSEQYDENGRLKRREQEVLGYRSKLSRRYAKSILEKDLKQTAEVLTEIKDFNKKYPEKPIDGSYLRQVLRGTARGQAMLENGVMLDRRLKERLRREAGLTE